MNKRITSLLLCFVMIFSLLFTVFPVSAVPGKTTTLTVTPDKATASPGETVTYTVTLGAVEDLLGIKFKLIIPEGLTFVTGAAKTGVKEALGATSAEFTPSTKVFLADPEYTSASDLDLMTFECTVDSSASGNLTVQLYIDDPDNYYDSDGDNIDVQVTNATITVTAASKPATGISLNKSTTTIYTGANETLIATVEPNDTTDTVTWTSSNTAVATVDTNGKVTAVATGTATITATAGSQSASCVVTVENAPCTHTNKTNVDAKPSTCKEQGWEAYSKCNDCGQLFDKDGNEISAIPYLSLAAHKYTANEKKPEALKTAGTCKDKAIYLRSCEVCGKVAPSEAWGTFYGDLDPNNHAGGTTTVNASEPDHKNQVDGYTGNTKCLGCNEIIAYGTPIPAGAHTPSSTWSSDGDYHWKTCSVAGCGVIIDGSKAAHTSTGANVATCQHKAVCDVCGVEYGEFAGHNPASGWTNDASGHWHACQTAGCTEKLGFAAHTPDREAATETDPVKCSVCDYVIEAQLAPKTPVTNIAVTITAPAIGVTPDYHPVYASTPENGVEIDEITWFKIAIADFTGTDEDEWDEMDPDEQFEVGYYYSVDMYFDTNDGYKLTESTTGTVNGKPHDSTYGNVFDEEFSNYGAYLCGLFEPLTAEYTIDLPVSLIVKLTGDKKPAKETFKFEIYDLGCEDAAFEIVNDTVVVENLEFDENGVAFADGIIKIKVTGEDQLCNLTEGFKVRMVKGSTKGWTYAAEQWYIEPFFENDALDFGIAVKEIVDGEISEAYANGMSYSVGYEAVTDNQPSQTGDTGMAGLWIALLLIGGVGVAGTVIFDRKRKYSVK